MKNFDARAYSVSDFLEWHTSGLLNLSPDFQRRPVWSANSPLTKSSLDEVGMV